MLTGIRLHFLAAQAHPDPQGPTSLDPAHETILRRDAHIALNMNPFPLGIGSWVDDSLSCTGELDRRSGAERAEKR